MCTPTRRNTFFTAASVTPWMLNLATRLLARALNMPEPLVHNTGVFVFVHVQAVDTSVGNRVLRQLRSWGRSASRFIAHPHSSQGDLS